MVKILIVEDEAALVTMLSYNLEKEGYQVSFASDGEQALRKIKEFSPDVVLLDWMLPKMSGVDVCKNIRRNNSTRDLPVIMLTARGEEADKVKGLSYGADDYMTKPFSVPELVARIRAVLRRTKPVEEKGELCFDDVVIDLTSHRVTRNGENVHLGPTEFRLLQFLMENPKRVFSREELLNSVWGEDIYVEVRTVDVHIRRLRKSLNENGGKDIIRTVRAAGYAIDLPQEDKNLQEDGLSE
jgi:two-component system phosphate regulon response regulator PhoB